MFGEIDFFHIVTSIGCYRSANIVTIPKNMQNNDNYSKINIILHVRIIKDF